MKKYFTLLIALVLLVAGCGKDNNAKSSIDASGHITIQLSSNGSFKLPSGENSINPEVSVDDFAVEIKNMEGNTVKSFKKYSEIKEAIELPIGRYTICAGNIGEKQAAFNAPEYFGTASFDVEKDKQIAVNLTCTLNNVMLTIRCTKKFIDEFGNNFSVTATNGSGVLEFTKEMIDNEQSGYFKVSDKGLSIYMSGKRVIDNSEINHTYEIPIINSQEHHIIELNAVATGMVSADGGIKIDVSVINKDHTIVIPGEDDTPVDPGEIPGGEGGEEQNEYLPEITGDGIDKPFVVKGEVSMDDNITVDVIIATLNGKTIDKLEIRIDSPALKAEDIGALIPLEFDMASADAELNAKLVGIGLLKKGDVIKGSDNFKFSIGSFVPMLFVMEDKPQTHKFHIKVTDSAGKVTSKTLIIQHLAE